MGSRVSASSESTIASGTADRGRETLSRDLDHRTVRLSKADLILPPSMGPAARMPLRSKAAAAKFRLICCHDRPFFNPRSYGDRGRVEGLEIGPLRLPVSRALMAATSRREREVEEVEILGDTCVMHGLRDVADAMLDMPTHRICAGLLPCFLAKASTYGLVAAPASIS